MAKTNTTKTSVDDVVTTNTTENVMNKEEKKVTNKSVNQEPLSGSDEIDVVSLIPNVSYKDNKTLDMYSWDVDGHIETMTFETIQNMWRNNKGYFKNLCLRPKDDRVVNKLGLTKTYEKYDFLMDASNYTKKNINVILDSISEMIPAQKFSICSKIKALVKDGKITDVSVIKALENRLKIDLIEFL